MVNDVSGEQENDGLSFGAKEGEESEPEEDMVRSEEPPEADDEARLRLRIFLGWLLHGCSLV